MVAGDAFPAHVWPWVSGHRRDLGRILVPVFAFGVAWWIADLAVSSLVWAEIIAYALVHLTLIGLGRGRTGVVAAIIAGAGLLTDVTISLALLFQLDAIDTPIYSLYLLIALRALAVYKRMPTATIIPFLLGPTYVFSYLLQGQPAAITINDQVAQWSLLLSSLGFGVVAIWSSTSTVRTNQLLRQELRDAQRAAEQRVLQLEQTANDLRTRMREQHALEEGLRVITSSLSLDEVLGQIVDSTLQMLGPTRVQGVALSLDHGGTFEHRALSPDGYLSSALADLLAARMMRQQVPLIISDITLDRKLVEATSDHVGSALSVPLFVGDGALRGALTVVSTARGAFSSGDVRHLAAFAMQAGIAIHNAELHSRVGQQQQLLGAVMRDITDGLVVLDSQSQVVLTNPLGRSLLDSPAATMPVREQLLALASSLRTADKHTLTCEIRMDTDDESDKAYQAFASQVRQDGSDELLIAIVLHDITAQKTEERNRTEFISMVAHELRNPLNSMNGFVKIVLQGRAGALTDLQQEFLEIVDSQVEQLKGRISELLEFNRLDAGKLALNPQWNDLPVLVAGTVTRLRLQAENAGLTLYNEVDNLLPECYFDSERIGQVLTNLVENAIKATPPGGTIRVSSELHEDEVWLRVCDSGVGIPAEEQSKIFNAFYRAHDRTSSKGNHLGLGLAICQQIIEGHQGRIWVESEQGVGSCFSFALPLEAFERYVAA